LSEKFEVMNKCFHWCLEKAKKKTKTYTWLLCV
jgi:hypothetical protein